MAKPTLIFGLGGTGGEIVDSFAKMISKRERKSDVKTIAIDTDRGELDSKVNIDERIALHQLFQSQKPRTKFISGFNSGI